MMKKWNSEKVKNIGIVIFGDLLMFVIGIIFAYYLRISFM